MDSLSNQPPSTEPPKKTEADTGTGPTEAVPYGPWDVAPYTTGPYMSVDRSLSLDSQTSLGDREVTPLNLNDLKPWWDSLKKDFHSKCAPAAEQRQEALAEANYQLGQFVNALCQFSVIKAKLSEEQISQYNRLLDEVLAEVKPQKAEAGTIKGLSGQEYTGSMAEFSEQLSARKKINAMLVKPGELKHEINELKEIDITPGSGKQTSTPPKAPYAQLEQLMKESWKDITFLSSLEDMPETADVAWLGGMYHSAIDSTSDLGTSTPVNIEGLRESCSFSLRTLRRGDYFQGCERLYKQTLTINSVNPEDSLHSTMSEENIVPLGQISEGSLAYTSSWGSQNIQGPARPVSQSFPPKPDFRPEPLSVAGFQGDKTLRLKPFTPEIAREFREKVSDRANDGFRYLGLKEQVKTVFTQLEENKGDLAIVSGLCSPAVTAQIYDTDYEGETAPYRHSQVTVSRPDGKQYPLCANHISYAGRPAGIAMSGPKPVEMPDVLQMAWENNTGVFLDLMTDSDRKSSRGKAYSRFDWADIPAGSGTKIGEYTITRDDEQVHDFDAKVSTREGERPARAFVRKFRISNGVGESKVISQIAFPGWTDGSAIDPDLMAGLQSLVADEQAQYNDNPAGLVVNCKAGVGRTGTFFAARHLREKAQNNQLDPDQLDSEVLQIILEGKLQRNAMFVQYPGQARLLYEMANRYAKEQRFAGADRVASPEPEKEDASPRTTRIGAYSLNPVTERMGQEYAHELEAFLNTHDTLKERYEAACLPDASQEEFEQADEAFDKVRSTLPTYTRLTTKAMVQAGVPEDQALAIQHSLHIRDKKPEIVLENTGNPYFYDSPEPYSENEEEFASKPRDIMAAPLMHTQVKVDDAKGHEIKLCANHITIAGKDMGIAMQAPRYEEMDLVLHAAFNNHIDAHVDLVSSRDREKLKGDWHREADPAIDWRHLDEYETDRYVLTAQAEPDSTVIPDENKEVNEYQLVHRTFTIKSKESGDERTLDQYTLVDWPDGEPLPHPVLKQVLQPLRGRKIMANCISGVGRSGSLFVGKHIDEEVAASGSGKGRGGQLALEGIIHTRLSRSGSAVSSPYQARELIRLEKSYQGK